MSNSAPSIMTPPAAPPGVNRSVLAGVFPADLGSDNAENVARQNLDRIKSKSSPPAAPPINDALKALEVPQLKRLEAFAKGEGDVSVVSENTPPALPETKAPEVKETPAIPAKEVVPAVEGLDDVLLNALESKVKPAVEPKVDTKVETKPADAPAIESDDAVPEPKTAKEMQTALAKLSGLVREKQKKIKELEAKGSIDVAATATEPLTQRIKDLEAANAQLLNSVAAVDLTQDPEIQRRYIQPYREAEAFIAVKAKKYEGISTRDLYAAANDLDEDRRHDVVRALCADMHVNDISLVEKAVDALHVIGGEWKKVQSNASTIQQQKAKASKEAQAAQMAQARTDSVKAHDKVFNELIANPVLARLMETNPDAKKELSAILEGAKASELDTAWVMDHEQRAKVLQQARAFPIVEKLYQAKLSEALKMIKSQKQQILNLSGGTGLSTQPRAAYVPPASDAPPQTTEAMVKGLFAAAGKR